MSRIRYLTTFSPGRLATCHDGLMRRRGGALAILLVATACSSGSSNPSSPKQSLTVTAQAERPGCAGTYVPGQQLQFTGGGFAPGVEATLSMTPATSSGDTLSILTADDSGTIHGSIQAPAVAGSVSISVTGLGPTGEEIDDSATFAVAQPGTSCAS